MSLPWSTDAPDGKTWECPNCASRATLGRNAAFHAVKHGHDVPVLEDMPVESTDWQKLQIARAALIKVREVLKIAQEALEAIE